MYTGASPHVYRMLARSSSRSASPWASTKARHADRPATEMRAEAPTSSAAASGAAVDEHRRHVETILEGRSTDEGPSRRASAGGRDSGARRPSDADVSGGGQSPGLAARLLQQSDEVGP